MNTETYFTLLCFLAQKRANHETMTEYEAMLYEAMCRSQASAALMQEAAFKLETQRINAILDSDTGDCPQKSS